MSASLLYRLCWGCLFQPHFGGPRLGWGGEGSPLIPCFMSPSVRRQSCTFSPTMRQKHLQGKGLFPARATSESQDVALLCVRRLPHIIAYYKCNYICIYILYMYMVTAWKCRRWKEYGRFWIFKTSPLSRKLEGRQGGEGRERRHKQNQYRIAIWWSF